jgi:starvation-inducible outer membrane lipoprotein
MKTMKSRALLFWCLASATVLLQGCIAFPPLIQVEHKDSANSNQEILKRLDAIDRRLGKLEKEKTP